MINIFSYRKKPVVIEAFQMFPNSWPNWPDWLKEAYALPEGERNKLTWDGEQWEIFTPEGMHKVTWGDFIIRGVKGELYPCKPDIFHEIYQKA